MQLKVEFGARSFIGILRALREAGSLILHPDTLFPWAAPYALTQGPI